VSRHLQRRVERSSSRQPQPGGHPPGHHGKAHRAEQTEPPHAGEPHRDAPGLGVEILGAGARKGASAGSHAADQLLEEAVDLVVVGAAHGGQ
jgi:hypothetical protein